MPKKRWCWLPALLPGLIAGGGDRPEVFPEAGVTAAAATGRQEPGQ
jgi:hypothetical protein